VCEVLSFGQQRLAPSQLLLVFRTLGDILRHPQNGGHCAVGIPHWGDVPLAEDGATVLVDVLAGGMRDQFAGGQATGDLLRKRAARGRGQQHVAVGPHDVFSPIAEELFGRGIPVDDAELRVKHDASDGHALELQLPPRHDFVPLALEPSPRLLGPPALERGRCLFGDDIEQQPIFFAGKVRLLRAHDQYTLFTVISDRDDDDAHRPTPQRVRHGSHLVGTGTVQARCERLLDLSGLGLGGGLVQGAGHLHLMPVGLV